MPNTPTSIEKSLVFEDNALFRELCGEHDSHLTMLETALDVQLTPRGNNVVVRGAQGAAEVAEGILLELYKSLEVGGGLSRADIEAAIRIAKDGVPVKSQEARGNYSISLQKRTISPRSNAQIGYVEALKKHEMVFGVGPAGTGKTYLAVAHAASLLLQGKVERVILSRPALEAGERIGFLPGDMKDKVDPYLRPLYDALYDVLHTEFVNRRLATGDIEIAPLAFMRGRTLSRSAIILDEAQNATVSQIKMFLTRLGEGSQMIITGDPSQSDLQAGEKSGLSDALDVLHGIDEVAVARFTAKDVVRHHLVAKIVAAYDSRVQQQRPGN